MTQSKSHLNTDEATEREEAQVFLPEVPESPTLACGVELIGKVEETGVAERQWLVRRGDRFVQLSGLLYRIVEQADGTRTHEEMVEGVTRSTDWAVSAENERQLLRGKLLPLGIVAPAEGTAFRDVRAGDLNISPLRINVRTRLLWPIAIDRITSVFQVLFAPFVLAPVLLVVAFTHAWLYLVHRVGGAM